MKKFNNYWPIYKNLEEETVKHDRRNNLMKGIIGNLIKSLGALYILNIYYRNDKSEYGTLLAPDKFFDNRLDSGYLFCHFHRRFKSTY